MVKVLSKARLVIRGKDCRDTKLAYYQTNKDACKLASKLGITITEARKILEKERNLK